MAVGPDEALSSGFKVSHASGDPASAVHTYPLTHGEALFLHTQSVDAPQNLPPRCERVGSIAGNDSDTIASAARRRCHGGGPRQRCRVGGGSRGARFGITIERA